MKSNVYATAGKLILAILFLFPGTKTHAQQFLTTIDGWNAYVHLPAEYADSTSKTYPLICFIPGTGECGTNPAKLLTYGPSKYVAEGSTMTFSVNGKTEKPIVISLQPINLWPSAGTINRKLDSIMARYRIDRQRVNVTGLSMGGWSWDNYVDNYSPVYNNRITSIVSMSAPEPDNTVTNMRHYALAGGTAWFFEGNMDLRGNDKIRDTMNYHVPGSARYTLYTGGHCCWNTFYNPSWTENGESIYTWMLKQRKALISGIMPPEANAGNDSTTTATLLTLPLSGYGNDPNGLPINFRWSKVSGPLGGVISVPNLLQTTVTGLILGTYEFELKVTNSLGLVAKDTFTINNGLAALPVSLLDITAKAKSGNTVLVRWRTNAEINSDYFVVERSSDGQHFSETSTLDSKGSASTGFSYYYTDIFPIDGVNMYRLRMVDQDGSATYSKIVTVNMKDQNQGIHVASANASDHLLQLKITSHEAKPATLNIVDGTGKKLLSSNIMLNTGINSLSQQVYLPRGVYYVNVSCGDENFTKAFIRE